MRQSMLWVFMALVMVITVTNIANAEEDQKWVNPFTWYGPEWDDTYAQWTTGGEPSRPSGVSAFFRGNAGGSLVGLSGIGSGSNPDDSLWSYGGQVELGLRFDRSREREAAWKAPLELSAVFETVSLSFGGTGYNVSERLHLVGSRLRIWSAQSEFYLGFTAWYPTEIEEADRANITFRSGASDFWGTIDLGFAGEDWSFKFAIGYPRSSARLDIVLNQEERLGLFLSGNSWGCPWDGGEHKFRLEEGTSRHEFTYQRYSGEFGVTWAPLGNGFHIEIYLTAGTQAFDPVSGGIDPPDHAFYGGGLRIGWDLDW